VDGANWNWNWCWNLFGKEKVLKLIICIIFTTFVISPHFAFAETFQVSIAQGSSSSGSGCQDVPNCYDPFETTIMQGDSVKWTNDDTAAHTVTSGTSQEGPDGFFASDPSLIIAGNMYTQVFDSIPPDDYTYFCLVHPWMKGIVHLLPNAVGGEIIPLDTTSLLLAGTYSNTSWLIPVIVTGIGIGFVILRKF